MTDPALNVTAATATEEVANVSDPVGGASANPRIRTVVRGGKAYSMNTANIGKWRRPDRTDRAIDTLIEFALRFTYRPPKEDQLKRHEIIRSYALEFARQIIGACPDSRERAVALTHIDSAMFFAIAAIDRRG